MFVRRRVDVVEAKKKRADRERYFRKLLRIPRSLDKRIRLYVDRVFHLTGTRINMSYVYRKGAALYLEALERKLENTISNPKPIRKKVKKVKKYIRKKVI